MLAAGVVGMVLLLSACSDDGNGDGGSLCDSLNAVNLALAELGTSSTTEGNYDLPGDIVRLATATKDLVAKVPASAQDAADAVESAEKRLRTDTNAFIRDLEEAIGFRVSSKYQPNVPSAGIADVSSLQSQVETVLSDADQLGSAMETLTGQVGKDCTPSST